MFKEKTKKFYTPRCQHMFNLVILIAILEFNLNKMIFFVMNRIKPVFLA